MDPQTFHYEIVVPKELESVLLESIGEAADHVKRRNDYTISAGDTKKAASELQFDPHTAKVLIEAGLFVANIVVHGVGAYFVEKGVARFAKKIAARRAEKEKQSGTAEKDLDSPAVPIVVRPPSGNDQSFDASDPTATKEAVDKLESDTD
jgi:hypothetical protein